MEQYKALCGREAQTKFRADWAAREVVKAKKFNTVTTSWSTVDVTKGEYVPFGVIVQREGGWEDVTAIAAAARYVRKAQLMAGAWVVYNNMTDRHDYLYLRKGFCQDGSNQNKTDTFLFVVSFGFKV